MTPPRFICLRLTTVLFSLTFLLFAPVVSRAARPALPAPMCGLVGQRLICYDEQTAAPTLISPEGQHVSDYAFAPDGNWLAYRVDSTITLVSIDGKGPTQIVDKNAAPPPMNDPAWTTLVWSPDGLAIAYVTADGLRVAFPPAKAGDRPRYANAVDSPYVNLRFSPGGQNLAAQATDSSWTLFAINSASASLQVMRTIDQASEAAWFDDTSLVIAPLAGGLMRLESTGDGAPQWTVPDEHFTKLLTTSGGQVLATHPDPGDTIGSVVSISPDGKVTPLGTSKIDSRVTWGPDGRMMLYLTSGTPILVNRATAAEDTLPIRGVTEVTWAPPAPRPTTSLPMDADLYVLASNGASNNQLWRLVRSGKQTVTQITHEPYNVLDFALSPDRSRAVLTTGGELVLTALDAPNNASDVILVTLNDSAPGFLEAQPDWRPDGQQIAYRDSKGIYLLDVGDLSLNTPSTPDLSKVNSVKQNPVFQKGPFALPRYNPDGHYLLARSASASPSQFYLFDVKEKNWQPLILNNTVANRVVWGNRGSLIAYNDHHVDGDLSVLPIADTVVQPTASTVDPTWHIADARFVSDVSLGFLREVGWSVGPEVVQLYTAPLAAGDPVPQGKPCAIPTAQLSPGGQFAAGIQRQGKIGLLVVADLQTCRKFRIQGVEDVATLAWVR